MKRNLNQKRGLAKLSHLNQSCRKKDTSKSSLSKEAISKYFTKEEPKEESVELITKATTSSDSLHMDSSTNKPVKEIKNILNESDDFKTPEIRRKAPKIFQAKTVLTSKQNKKKKSSKKNKIKAPYKNTILKTTEDNFLYLDVNPEHLQMALALSRSSYAAENLDNCNDSNEIPNMHNEKVAVVKTTLERFGFKSEKPVQTEMRSDLLDVPKKKNSKFRFITPTLNSRTTEERESMIVSKMSLILSQNKNYKNTITLTNQLTVFSDFLKRYWFQESKVLKINSLCLEKATNFCYYTENLNITPVKYKCGHLLKNWDDIPGREKSPEREIHIVKRPNENCDEVFEKCENACREKEYSNSSKQNEYISENSTEIVKSNLCTPLFSPRNCISPDIFESDSETEYLSKSPDSDFSSQSLLSLSPTKSKCTSSLKNTNDAKCEVTSKRKILTNCSIFRSDSGIEHFENYKLDSKNLSQEIYHVTQSSEDEDTEQLFVNSIKQSNPSTCIDLTQDESNEDKNVKNDQNYKVNEIIEECKEDRDQERYVFLVEKNIPLEDTGINIDILPAQIVGSSKFKEESNVTSKDESTYSLKTNFHCPTLSEKNIGTDKIGNNSTDRQSVFALRELSFDSTEILNVTDYITQILNNDDKVADEETKKIMSTSINGSEGICNLNFGLNHLSTSHTDIDNMESNKNGNMYIDCECQIDCNIETSTENFLNDETIQYSSSQESIIISDEELNYSCIHSRHSKYDKSFFDLSTMDKSDENNMEIIKLDNINDVHSGLKQKYLSQGSTNVVHNAVERLKEEPVTKRCSLTKEFFEDSLNNLLEDPNILDKIENCINDKKMLINNVVMTNTISTNNANLNEKVTSTISNVNPTTHNSKTNVTPESNLIIKLKNITPMVNYKKMDTPNINKELQKFGVKPLKRQRGIKLLNYFYDCTHPVVDSREINNLSSDEDEQRLSTTKKVKIDYDSTEINLENADTKKNMENNIQIIEDVFENENLEDLIFERKHSVKISTCHIPLQIIWHNFLSNNPKIKENILLYEPLQLEVLHSMLKEQSGCKFHMQDLLTFFDKKCITVRIAQNSQSTRKTKKKGYK